MWPPSFDGTPAVVLDIERQPGANIVQTVQAIKDALPSLQAPFRPGSGSVHRQRPHGHDQGLVKDVQFT